MSTMKVKMNNSTEKSPELFDEDIRLMAYYLWEEKGSIYGAEIEDWIAAETYLKKNAIF